MKTEAMDTAPRDGSRILIDAERRSTARPWVGDTNGIPDFDLLHGGAVFLQAFDLLDLDGQDLRDRPLWPA
jgi:hypothetical protein